MVNQLNSIERNNAGQVTSSSYTDMFMATCFCAYVRKMKELDILPQLNFSAAEVQEQNFQNVKTLIHAISPNQYTKEQNIREDIILNHGDIDDERIYVPEEEEIFHLPFFFK